MDRSQINNSILENGAVMSNHDVFMIIKRVFYGKTLWGYAVYNFRLGISFIQSKRDLLSLYGTLYNDDNIRNAKINSSKDGLESKFLGYKGYIKKSLTELETIQLKETSNNKSNVVNKEMPLYIEVLFGDKRQSGLKGDLVYSSVNDCYYFSVHSIKTDGVTVLKYDSFIAGSDLQSLSDGILMKVPFIKIRKVIQDGEFLGKPIEPLKSFSIDRHIEVSGRGTSMDVNVKLDGNRENSFNVPNKNARLKKYNIITTIAPCNGGKVIGFHGYVVEVNGKPFTSDETPLVSTYSKEDVLKIRVTYDGKDFYVYKYLGQNDPTFVHEHYTKQCIMESYCRNLAKLAYNAYNEIF